MASEDLVFEFFVKNISCKNTKSRSSPLVIEMNGCAEITMAPKVTTICKLTYNKGKRVIFNQTNFTDIQTTFTLLQGHGDSTVRARTTFDFYKIYSANNDEFTPTVFNVEVGLDSPNGSKFGTMELSFQIFPYSELLSIQHSYAISKVGTHSTRKINSRRSQTSASQLQQSSRSTFKTVANVSARQPEPGAPTVPRLNIQSALTSSRSNSSIHDRYLKKNEMWLGHHCSTRADTPLSTRSSTKSATRSPRISAMSSLGNFPK